MYIGLIYKEGWLKFEHPPFLLTDYYFLVGNFRS